MDAGMAKPDLASHRHRLLSSVQERVLEIGFGTGANLPYYPKRVKSLVAIDVNPGMSPLAKRRIKEYGRQVDHRILDVEKLPFSDGEFDSVVSSWTLCSVKDTQRALEEIHRVLNPLGCFFFLEHGLSPDSRVQRWQYRLNRLNRMVACGCELIRPIPKNVERAGFIIDSLEEFYIPKIPSTHGYMYQGVARKKR